MIYYPKKSLVCLLAILGISLALACGGDDSPSPEALRQQELTATWSVASVINDGQDVSSQFTGFSLTITSEQTYSTVNGGNPWPAQGTFELVANNLDEFIRDDGVRVVITSIDETTLSLTFQITDVGGRAFGSNGITGTFTFNLNKTS